MKQYFHPKHFLSAPDLTGQGQQDSPPSSPAAPAQKLPLFRRVLGRGADEPPVPVVAVPAPADSVPVAAGSNGRWPSMFRSQELEEPQNSQEVLERQLAAVKPGKNLLLYCNSSDPAGGKRRAAHVPCNTTQGVPIETPAMSGQMLVMYKPGQGFPGGHPHESYFAGKRRMWEIRLQVRFKQVLSDRLWMGIVFHDFNYMQQVASVSKMAWRIGSSIIPVDFYHSWGDRMDASKKPDAELGHLCMGFTIFDQVIVTPSGKTPPPLTGDLSNASAYGTNYVRKEMGVAKYAQAMKELLKTITPQDTITLCNWGFSQVVDLVNWKLMLYSSTTGLKTLKIGTELNMSVFWQDSPVHFCMYELAEGAEGEAHSEKRKTYLLDLMILHSEVDYPTLPELYNFVDAPAELERQAASVTGSLGASGQACGPSAEPKAASTWWWQRRKPQPTPPTPTTLLAAATAAMEEQAEESNGRSWFLFRRRQAPSPAVPVKLPPSPAQEKEAEEDPDPPLRPMSLCCIPLPFCLCACPFPCIWICSTEHPFVMKGVVRKRQKEK